MEPVKNRYSIDTGNGSFTIISGTNLKLEGYNTLIYDGEELIAVLTASVFKVN